MSALNSTDLVRLITQPDLLTRADEDLLAEIEDLGVGLTVNTRRSYGSDLVDYTSWCDVHNRDWYKPRTIAAYLRYLHKQGTALSTVTRRLSAIHKMWQVHTMVNNVDGPDPTKHASVKNAVLAIRAEAGSDVDGAPPLTLDLLLQTLLVIDTDAPAGRRDIAMLLVGWYGALRRSEIAGMRRLDIRFEESGAIIRLAKTKSSTRAVEVSIPAHPNSRWNPISHLQTWLTETAHDSGAVIWARSNSGGTIRKPTVAIGDHGINAIVQRRIKAAAIAPLTIRIQQPDQETKPDDDPSWQCDECAVNDPHKHVAYSAHSLRSGFITEAKNRRIDEYEIMRHTRHKTVTVMRMYDNTTGRWDRNPATKMSI